MQFKPHVKVSAFTEEEQEGKRNDMVFSQERQICLEWPWGQRVPAASLVQHLWKDNNHTQKLRNIYALLVNRFSGSNDFSVEKKYPKHYDNFEAIVKKKKY